MSPADKKNIVEERKKLVDEVLEVYPELYDVKKNLRVMTLERAREERLID